MTRQILRFLGTRYGIALVLLLLVMGVVGIARAVSGPTQNAPVGPPPVATTSAPPASGELGDDSVANPEPSPEASSIPGSPAPDVVAMDFARAWLDTKGKSSEQWLAGMAPHATESLLDKLTGVDPTRVPADAVVGPARMVTRDALLAEVSIPVQPGTLVLRVLATSGRWLVDGVDWKRP